MVTFWQESAAMLKGMKKSLTSLLSRIVRSALTGLLCISLLAGCGAAELFMPTQLGSPDFVGQPYVFHAYKIDVVASDNNPQTDVQDRYKFPTNLTEGVIQWTKQRVRTPSGQYALQLEIKRADVTEEEEIHGSVWSFFGSESTFHYHGTLEAVLKLYRPGSKTATVIAETKVERLTDISSTAKRQELFNRLVLSILYEFDTNMSFLIPQRFAPYLIAY